ncbi:MAG TPA: Gfo/Idh/MocA family oxidoreductase, partial [Actinopolymorphaceae bacterium]
NKLLYPRMEVETAGTLVVTFDNGTVATIDCSWSKPQSYPTWGTVTLEFVGENGVVSVDAFGQTIDSYYDGPNRGGEQNVAWLPWGGNADVGMIEEFLSAIRERRAPTPSGLDGLRATEIAFAAYRSVAAGQPVPVSTDATAGSPA